MWDTQMMKLQLNHLIKVLVCETSILIHMGRLFLDMKVNNFILVPGSQPERLIVTVWIQSDSPFDRRKPNVIIHTTTGNQQLKTIQTIIIYIKKKEQTNVALKYRH